jgi:hypothetical protein
LRTGSKTESDDSIHGIHIVLGRFGHDSIVCFFQEYGRRNGTAKVDASGCWYDIVLSRNRNGCVGRFAMTLLAVGISLLILGLVGLNIERANRIDKTESMNGYFFGVVCAILANGIAATIVGLWQMNQP